MGPTLILAARSSDDKGSDLNRALGKWNSTERFEGEPRISVSFRSNGPSIEGWAMLLGQHRKNDDREGSLGWELHLTTPTTVVLLTAAGHS